MKWLVGILLGVEAAVIACILTQAISNDLAVILLALNSVLLILTATRLRRKPSCCR